MRDLALNGVRGAMFLVLQVLLVTSGEGVVFIIKDIYQNRGDADYLDAFSCRDLKEIGFWTNERGFEDDAASGGGSKFAFANEMQVVAISVVLGVFFLTILALSGLVFAVRANLFVTQAVVDFVMRKEEPRREKPKVTATGEEGASEKSSGATKKRRPENSSIAAGLFRQTAKDDSAYYRVARARAGSQIPHPDKKTTSLAGRASRYLFEDSSGPGSSSATATDQAFAPFCVMLGIWSDFLKRCFVLEERAKVYSSTLQFENTDKFREDLQISTAKSVGMLMLLFPGGAAPMKVVEYMNMCPGAVLFFSISHKLVYRRLCM